MKAVDPWSLAVVPEPSTLLLLDIDAPYIVSVGRKSLELNEGSSRV
jgi:hypothetical protein